MRNLPQFGIIISALFLCAFTAASPPLSGPGPGFEPNMGSSRDEIEMQMKYRSLLDENAALKEEVCPMCIRAAPQAGERLSVNDRIRMKAALGEDRYYTYLEVTKELVSQ